MAKSASTSMRSVPAAAGPALLAGLLLACDPAAEASGQGGGSGELESCSETSQCEAGLRCVQNVCIRESTSVVGEYHAAVGRSALERGNVEGAIEQYSRAVNQYEADDTTTPAPLYCEQGHALVADRDNPESAEVAARVLHRCLLRTPAGSDLRRRALSDLVLLGELGLEPLTLKRKEPADAYLTRSPSRPPVEELEVELEGSGTRARTLERFVSHLESEEDLAEELAPCWEAYWESTYEEELTLTIPFRYTFRLTKYEDFDRAVIAIPDESPPSGKGMGEAYECATEVLEPMADEFSQSQYDEVRWNAEIEFTIKGV